MIQTFRRPSEIFRRWLQIKIDSPSASQTSARFVFLCNPETNMEIYTLYNVRDEIISLDKRQSCQSIVKYLCNRRKRVLNGRINVHQPRRCSQRHFNFLRRNCILLESTKKDHEFGDANNYRRRSVTKIKLNLDTRCRKSHYAKIMGCM